MLAENAFRRDVESTTTTLRHHPHPRDARDLRMERAERLQRHQQHRATHSASSASPMDDRSPLASPSRVVTGFAASAASSYDGGGGGSSSSGGVPPGAASPPVASPRARAVGRALLGEALDADAKTRVGGLGAMDTDDDNNNNNTTATTPMDDSVKSDASVFSGSLYDDLDDAVGGRSRSRDALDEDHDDAVDRGFARSSPIDIPTWDRKPAHWKTCV